MGKVFYLVKILNPDFRCERGKSWNLILKEFIGNIDIQKQ